VLAAQPGRADQAVELALPDRDARRALFDHYRADL
jgi:ATP-dependent 26S proteasome regulatory subunit